MANLAGFSSGAFGAIINHFTRHQDDPEQTKWKYKNQEIDPQRTWMNYAIQQIRAPKDFIQAAIDSVDVPIKNGKKATNVLSDWVITLPKNELLEGREKEFFEQTFEFMKTKVPEDLIVGGYVHMDETSPHMHFAFVPLVTTQAMTNDKNQPLRDGKGKILKDKKGTVRYKRVPKLDADGNPIMRRSFGQSKIFDRKAMENFHPQLEKALSDYFGFKVGIELEDEGERLLSSLNQPQYIKAKQTLEKQQEEIAKGEERLECLQEAQDREERAIGEIESEIRAVEVSTTGAGDFIGSKAEARKLEAEIEQLGTQVRNAERGVGELGERVEQTRSAVDGRLDQIAGLERGIDRCQREKLVVDRETSRLEKACSLLSRALDLGASAVAQALAKLTRTNDLRQSTWSFGERTIAEAMCEMEISELKERPAKNKLDKAIAEVEYRIEKFKTRVRYGFSPKKGLIEYLWKKKSDLESQTPEAIALDRNLSAKRRVLGLCSDIYACRGPRKEQIKSEIAKIAKDKTLWSETRDFAESRIAWIDAGAPSGSPAGGSGSSSTAHSHGMAQGGEARGLSIGGDAR
jgi:hypothetical protein